MTSNLLPCERSGASFGDCDQQILTRDDYCFNNGDDFLKLYTAKLAMPAQLFWSRLPWLIYGAIGKEENNYMWYNKIICNGIIGRHTALILGIVSH